MRAFIDQYRHTHGVESVCKVLQIAPSGYRRYAAQQRDATRLSCRAKRDAELAPHIERKRSINRVSCAVQGQLAPLRAQVMQGLAQQTARQHGMQVGQQPPVSD